MFVSTQNSNVEWNLILRLFVFGSGAFGRWLGHEGRALMNEISALLKEAAENSLAPYVMWEHSKKMAVHEPGSSGQELVGGLHKDHPSNMESVRRRMESRSEEAKELLCKFFKCLI